MPREPAPDPFDEIAMRYMEDHTPRCSCGRRFKLGGLEGVGSLLVCGPCSYFEAPDEEWLERARAEAFDHAERTMS